MFNGLFTHRGSSPTSVSPLRLLAIEEEQIVDRNSLKTWEKVIKEAIARFNRLLPGAVACGARAQLTRLEPTSEEEAVEKLGGPAATVSALYLHTNIPGRTSGCLMLALDLGLASSLTRLARQVVTDTSEDHVQDEVSDFHQLSNVLAYSLASTIAKLCHTPSQYSPPVILIDSARVVTELVRTGLSERQDDNHFLTGVIGITAGKSYFEGTFALCCPGSLLEEVMKYNHTGPSGKRTASHTPTLSNSLPGLV